MSLEASSGGGRCCHGQDTALSFRHLGCGVVWRVPGRQHMDPGVASPSSEQRCLRNSSFLSLVGKADFPLRMVTRAVSLLLAQRPRRLEQGAGWCSQARAPCAHFVSESASLCRSTRAALGSLFAYASCRAFDDRGSSWPERALGAGPPGPPSPGCWRALVFSGKTHVVMSLSLYAELCLNGYFPK